MNKTYIIMILIMIIMIPASSHGKTFDLVYKFKDDQNFLLTYKYDGISTNSGNETKLTLSGTEKINVRILENGHYLYTVTGVRCDIEGDREMGCTIDIEPNDCFLLEKDQEVIIEIDRTGKRIKVLKKPQSKYEYPNLHTLTGYNSEIGKQISKSLWIETPLFGRVWFTEDMIFRSVDEDNNVALLSGNMSMQNLDKTYVNEIFHKFKFDLEKGYITRAKFKINSSIDIPGCISFNSFYMNWDMREIFDVKKKKKSEFDW